MQFVADMTFNYTSIVLTLTHVSREDGGFRIGQNTISLVYARSG